MSNALVSRVGQINKAGDDRALYLKLFGGEVMTSFAEKNIAEGLHTTKQISQGKSWQFPLIGTHDQEYYHTPGEEILGKQIGQAEQIITVDNLLVAPVFIARIDEALSHFEVRSEYAKQCGRTLANHYDKNVLRTMTLAARASSPLTGRPGGAQITLGAAGDETNPDKLVEAFFQASQMCKERDLPEEDNVILVRPAQYHALIQSDKLMNADFNSHAGNNYVNGSIDKASGMKIMWTNHLPDSNVTGTYGNKYDGDFTKTTALVVNKRAAATVKLMDISVESQYDVRRQGTLLVAKMATGHGVLDPSAAIEIQSF